MKINLINDNFTSNYVENLLKARGVENVQDYFKPTAEYLQSPLDLKNIRVAAALYTRIVLNNKPPYSRVLIVVDSDNDGYTSAAIIYQYTKRLNCHCKIDYWLHEGKQHGLQDHIDRLMAQDCQYDLIILPDSSSNDANYHDMLDEINTPCLILDHHLTDVKLSDNAVVVNNQLSPNYKNKELTGAGVVYQFCRYVDSITGNNWADDYLDLAAWGIIGDMGSMIDMENRYIVETGLSEAHIKNDFFKCLLEKQAYSITGKMNASWTDIVEATNAISVAFYIVPLVNAMIRVGTMPEKERLFLAFIDGGRMVPSGKRGAKGAMERVDIESARECTNAKNKQNRLKEAAVDRLEAKIFKYDLLENKVLFVRLDDDDDFPAELNGLIAMQLSAKFKKPTIVARLNSQGFNRGSARGLNQSELKDFRQFLLNTEMFEYAQGHANAFGISIPDYKLREFHAYANEALRTIDFGENIYDVNFTRTGNSADLYQLVVELGKAGDIWGQNNPQPLVYVSNITVNPSNIRVMGSNQDTVKIEANGMSYLKFHAKDLIEELKNHTGPFTLEIVGKPNLNEWMGRVTPQMFIEDYEIKETTLF
jgi:single-stranded-DNA-specific exonuclease